MQNRDEIAFYPLSQQSIFIEFLQNMHVFDKPNFVRGAKNNFFSESLRSLLNPKCYYKHIFTSSSINHNVDKKTPMIS